MKVNMTNFSKRMNLFNSTITERNKKNVNSPKMKFTCLCCGYPTIDDEPYEVCSLCNWENIGQINPEEYELPSEINNNYSLSQARKNFEIFLIMYNPDKVGDKKLLDSKKEYGLKIEIVEMCEEMIKRNFIDISDLLSSVEITLKKLNEEIEKKGDL